MLQSDRHLRRRLLRRPLLLLTLLAAATVAACGSSATPPIATAAPTTGTPDPGATASPAVGSPPAPTDSAAPSPSESPSSAGPATGPGAATIAAIERAQAEIAADANDGDAYLALGAAFLQRARETADPSYYGKADEALGRARVLLPKDPIVLVGIGTLQLARHEFADALVTGKAALAIEPDISTAEGVVVDAFVELGRYDDAAKAAQTMVNLRPDLASFARVSYLRELYGDLPGALDAMEQAANAAGATPENSAYVTVLVGNLRVLTGDRSGAAAAYAAALADYPLYAPALAAQGRLAIAAGDLATAKARFQAAADIVPLPEYVIALGEIAEASGDTAGAATNFGLARVETQLFQANGVVVDLELGLFEADHGDPATALSLARTAYAERKTVKAADTLAWALYRNGRIQDALVRSHDALRLGSRDPILRYHAGMIEAAAGQTAAARRDLKLALALDPGFSATGAAAAKAELAKLG